MRVCVCTVKPRFNILIGGKGVTLYLKIHYIREIQTFGIQQILLYELKVRYFQPYPHITQYVCSLSDESLYTYEYAITINTTSIQ